MKDKYVRQELYQVVTHAVAQEGIKVTAIVLPDLEPGDAVVVRQVFIGLTGTNGVKAGT